MKLKYLLVLEAVFSLATGFGLVLAPKMILFIYRLDSDATGIFMSQNAGGLYFGLGLLAWLVRNLDQVELRRPICLTYSAYHIILLIVALIAWLAGDFDFQYGWISAIIELSFAAGFGYFYFAKTNTR
jgi:hypothetical protein